MSEKKQCVKCDRNIDAAAKSCLYCNWWQADPPPARAAMPAADAAPAAPEHRLSRKVRGGLAFAALVIIAFVIGSLVHGFEPNEIKAAQQPKTTTAASASAAPATTPPQATVPLVPDNSAPAAAPGQPMPMAAETPVNGSMTNPQPNDATAMTSEQYGAATQRSQAQAPQPQPVDPRSLTGAAYQQGDQAPMPAHHPRRQPSQVAQAPRRVMTTQPVAEYQPVPSLHGHGRARLTLTVGPDGRVKDIDVIDSISGEMGRLIGAVQSWRFSPATQNGVPVTSRFTVDINVE